MLKVSNYVTNYEYFSIEDKQRSSAKINNNNTIIREKNGTIGKKKSVNNTLSSK